MNVARWNAWRELKGISKRLHHLFPEPDAPPARTNEEMIVPDWMPSVDVMETEEAFEVKAELPGVKQEEVRITMDHGILNLQGERQQERDEKGRRVHRVERSYGRFVRSFTLPNNIDVARAKVAFNDGVLLLQLPKVEQAQRGILPIKAAA